jgi:FixJ family two-component response regulator
MSASTVSISGTHREATVFVVDDDVSVRESLELLVRDAGWRPRLFASAESFLACPPVTSPKCLVLDLTLPDRSGLDLQRQINIEQPGIPIIFITGHADVPLSVRAMRAGAFDFLIKPFVEDELLRAITSAIDRSQKALLAEAMLRDIRDRYSTLTSREREVMHLVASGLQNKHIGSELHISEITVKAHRGKLMHKMHAASLPDLVRMHSKLFG